MKKRKTIIKLLMAVTLLILFNSIGFAANDNYTPYYYVDYETECEYQGFFVYCCDYLLKYDSNGYLISRDLIGCHIG